MLGPEDIINRAIDALGADDQIIGSFSDGTRVSESARRTYGPMLRQLLRGAPWNFARKIAPLELLADASGNTLAPNTNVSISRDVEPPWIYAYAWPTDGVAARWLPWRLGEISTTQPPLYTNMANTSMLQNQYPARFLVSSSDQFPAVTGETEWGQFPDLDSIEGVGPIGRRIVLTDVCHAHLVYTRLVLAVQEWDPLFSEAMVAFMAQRLALVARKDDPKAAIALRNGQVAIVKSALMEARARNANDAGFPQSINRQAPWIRARGYGMTGWGACGLSGGPGVLGYGWDSVSFADGSVF